MNIEIRPFDETTIDDFKDVVRARFSEGATGLADKVIMNPAREPHSNSGAVGYEDGVPKCIRASIVRRLFLGHIPFFGTVGGMLAKKHGANRALLKAVVADSISPRRGSKVFFTNTSVRACVNLNQEAGVAGHGPEQWMFQNLVVFRPFLSRWIRFSAIHPRLPKLRFSKFTLLRECAVVASIANGLELRRELILDDAELDDFWRRYLENNRGLVASRSSAEVKWAFGSRVRDGNVVFISLRSNNVIEGYVAASYSGVDGCFWKILDWIALDNNMNRLEFLMRAMVDFIRKNTPAVELEIAGFPEYAQPIIDKYVTKKVPIGHNPYLFHCYDAELLKRIRDKDVARASWFWGPYDGDMCME